MKEDFLHYVWKFKNFQFLDITTSTGEPLTIVSTGEHNHNAGPDFLNARIKIADQLWAGTVEIHIKSSDWYVHGHEKDDHYNNVILHVVWEDDVEVFRSDNSAIPALALKELVSGTALKNYRELFNKNKTFINCEKHFHTTDDFIIKNWIERLYFERLEEKSKMIFRELENSNNDWEAVLFRLLMKNFGLNVNGLAFYSIARAVEYSLIRKIGDNGLQLEALFLGLAGLLDDAFADRYKVGLKNEYLYLIQKFNIADKGTVRPKFSRLRPANFPTIRLSQLAGLYNTHQNLFSKIITGITPETYYAIFNVKASEYWSTHYTFGKTTTKKEKKLSAAFIQLLIVNTILPLKFCYSKYTGNDGNEELMALVKALKPENNTIIEKYRSLHITVPSAMESQALLQLYNSYCSRQQCLRCAVGSSVVRSDRV